MPQNPTLHFTMEMDKDFEKKLEDALDKELLDEGMKMFAEKVKEVWTEKANNTLHETKDEYLKGLTVEATDDGVNVTLSGALPVWLEEGTPFDMKTGVLPRIVRSDSFTTPDAKGRISPFRTISKDAPDDAWWTPQREGNKIAEQVRQELPRINKEVFDALISRIKI